jgi:hypothetical protein
MKKKIICIGIVCLFITTGLAITAVGDKIASSNAGDGCWGEIRVSGVNKKGEATELSQENTYVTIGSTQIENSEEGDGYLSFFAHFEGDGPICDVSAFSEGYGSVTLEDFDFVDTNADGICDYIAEIELVKSTSKPIHSILSRVLLDKFNQLLQLPQYVLTLIRMIS